MVISITKDSVKASLRVAPDLGSIHHGYIGSETWELRPCLCFLGTLSFVRYMKVINKWLTHPIVFGVVVERAV